jgi:hypothetical protein
MNEEKLKDLIAIEKNYRNSLKEIITLKKELVEFKLGVNEAILEFQTKMTKNIQEFRDNITNFKPTK